MSRADLARKLGLNRSSSGQIVAELTQSGLVRDVEGPPPVGLARTAGRPGILLELVPDAAVFVGMEIGVEHISTVTIDLAGRRLGQRKRPFETAGARIEEAVELAVELALGEMDRSTVAQCRGVGVSAPVHVRADGRVTVAPLIGWRDPPLARIVEAALPVSVPVMIENDANALAIGDSYKHGPSGVTLFLLMESGIGGGILIDGKLFRGGHGLSGEIGHVLVPGSGGISLEQLIGREVLVRRHRAEAARPQSEFSDFLAAVLEREPIAVSIAEDWSRHLGFTLQQACRLIDPVRIVLGGSVAALYPMVSARVAAHMSARQAVDFPLPQIVVDEDAEFGSAFGAACLMHQRFLSSDIGVTHLRTGSAAGSPDETQYVTSLEEHS
jgi:predicted NBD/HSP70 family sugar kinase